MIAFASVAALVLSICRTGIAADPPQEPAAEPLLRLDTGGPTSFVTSLAFDADSRTLYAGGWDKVVRAWTGDGQGRFTPDKVKTIRVPLGPGLSGAINAVAFSPDGRVLAVAGRGVVEGVAGFRQPGRILPTKGGMTKDMQLDEGVIYLIDRLTREVHELRGHLGPVLALAFEADSDGIQVLASAGQEPGRTPEESCAVVRLWNVATREYLRGIYVDVAEVKTRPQLAVRRSGPKPDDVTVIIAWNDGKLRVWNAASDQRRPVAYQDGRNNKTIAFLPGNQSFITGSLQISDGSIAFWQLDQTGNATRETPFTIPPANGSHFLPQALAVLSHGGKRFSAVACQSVDLRNAQLVPVAMELQLVDLTQRSVVFRAPLWSNRGVAGTPLPTLACSRDGEFVAVAGGPDHVVQVFRVTDMLQRRVDPQRLRSKSSSVAEAHFVTKGNERGIFLTEVESDRGLVFNLETRQLAAFQRNSGWRYDRPRVQNWNVTVLPRRIVVRSPQGQQQTVTLPAEQEEVTKYALLPAGRQGARSLLAVASHSLGQPMLALYDVNGGNQVRQYTGHTERIHSLSFSDDGRLLISAAEDQTARVWSLTDLDQILEQHGMLPGVSVDDDNAEGVTVVDVERSSPAGQWLAAGDRLLGYLQNGELRRWANAREFYDTWWQLKPATSLTIRRLREGQVVRDVVLRAIQGVDERKPLFSFFLARPVQGQGRQWIGWSPLGPFESSDEQIEEYLGWHFNTSDPRRPTGFADLNQYRQQFYHEGLLEDLITHGRLPREEDAETLPSPEMSLLIPELGTDPVKSDGHLLIRQRQEVTLALSLDFEFPADSVAEVECRFDGRSLGTMRRAGDRRWQIDLSQAPWRRQVHLLEAVLRTNERQPQEFTKDIRVRFQPPAPGIELAESTLAALTNLKADSDQVLLEAEVVPAPDESVQVEVFRLQGREKIPEFNSPGSFSKSIKLQPGPNHLRIEARNTRAMQGHAEIETTIKMVTFIRPEPEVVRPRIAVDVVEPHVTTRDIKFDDVVRVQSSTLALKGYVSADRQPQLSVVRTVGEESQPIPATFAKVQDDGRFAFDATLEGLAPQQRTSLELVASVGQVNSQWRFDIDYQPPIPRTEIVATERDQRVIITEDQQTTADVSANLLFPEDVEVPEAVIERLRGRVQVNDGEWQPVQLDPSQRILTARAPVALGRNRVRFQVYYEWDEDHFETSDPIYFEGILPFRVLDLQVAQQDGELEAVAEFEVKTDVGISSLFIGKREVSPDDWNFNHETGLLIGKVKFEPKPDTNLEIRVPGLPKRIRVELPEAEKLVRIPKPPSVEFLTPSQDSKTSTTTLSVKFAIHSPLPISRAELLRGGDRVFVVEAAELKQLTARQGPFHFEKTVPVDLLDGRNSLQLIADNADGRQISTLNVSRIPTLVRVAVNDAITENGDRIDVRSQPANEPLITLRGSVIWGDRNDPRLKTQGYAKIWVDGLQQSLVELKPAGPRLEREFAAPILLCKRGDNLVEIELPSLQHDVGEVMSFRIKCTKPVTDYRLHLLVIGVGKDTNGNDLLDQALKTLEGRRVAGTDILFKTPVFADGWIYGPLAGEIVSKRTVFTQLNKIEDNIYIQNRRRGTRAHDVVIVYYSGGELVPKEHQFLLTTNPGQDPIPSSMLTSFVDTTPGAHLLLLDVSRNCNAHCRTRTWPAKSHAALMRYAWLKPGQMPSETRLIAALNEIGPQDNELGELDQQLENQYREVSQRFPASLVYDRHIPDALRTLQLRQ